MADNHSSVDPANIKIEMFDIDAYACDLNHEPIDDATFQPGHFARICVHTIDIDSDIIVQGMRYFVFVSEEASDLQDAAIQFSDNHGKVPSMACTAEDNMCVIETILDESLFDNHDDGTPVIYGYGALVLGRSGPAQEYDQFEDVPIQITLSTDSDYVNGNVGDHAPNLEGESPAVQKFLRGTSQNV
eukprot:CAMPEP_0113624034 /NCGR_PEP_ID=MMETSP0017_2-20120614/12383_1 /TAXON_ID=2856 /ORGANISM="Cylindrotheca closterium" /LENGTH=186 /DNA_ID=CAMNT_0000534039 /DNA_START=145 /DNA_END=705 /DNA_ORIENTATION=+ /assembly_acc=CAM_ASM_000147